MNDDALTLAAEAGEGGIRLLSPKLGIWTDRPADGALLGPGACAGRLTVIRKHYRLLLPDGASGRVLPQRQSDRAVAVAFGETLMVLAPIAEPTKGPAGTSVNAATLAGTYRLLAPTAGVYYGAPAPGAPPYVTRGSRVHAGQAVGLLEVMKTFNPIPYEGAGLPDEAEVVEVLAADGQEVGKGQPLLVVK